MSALEVFLEGKARGAGPPPSPLRANTSTHKTNPLAHVLLPRCHHRSANLRSPMIDSFCTGFSAHLSLYNSARWLCTCGDGPSDTKRSAKAQVRLVATADGFGPRCPSRRERRSVFDQPPGADWVWVVQSLSVEWLYAHAGETSEDVRAQRPATRAVHVHVRNLLRRVHFVRLEHEGFSTPERLSGAGKNKTKKR